MKRVLCILLFALLCTAQGSYAKSGSFDPATIGNRDVGRGVNFYSIEKEIALGKDMAEEVELQSRVLDDPVISEYVNRIGQNLVRNSDAKVPFTIKVIDSDEVNAFALPGGFFFVNTGLILKADNEAELAGVMAHEIGHVAARHGTRQATRAEIVDYSTLPLVFMGGWAGYAIREAAQLAIPLGFMKFSRGMEGEADTLGLEYMYKAGYDPTAFVDFFERIQSLEKSKPGTISRLFSSHPPSGSRIRAAQKNIQQLLAPKPEYVVNTSGFNRIKARLVSLQNRRKSLENSFRPSLRIAPGADPTNGEDTNGRPTLKRRN